MLMGGPPEQTVKNINFQATLRKHFTPSRVTEPYIPYQNPKERTIRKLRKKWYRTMLRTNCLKKIWGYGYRHKSKIMCRMASRSRDLNGRTPIDHILGETPDISEYLDFDLYDRFWFKQASEIGETRLGRWLGVADNTGYLMSY